MSTFEKVVREEFLKVINNDILLAKIELSKEEKRKFYDMRYAISRGKNVSLTTMLGFVEKYSDYIPALIKKNKSETRK
jgi:hypothetical protein